MCNFEKIKKINLPLYHKINKICLESEIWERIVREADGKEVDRLAQQLESEELMLILLSLKHVDLSPSEVFSQYKDEEANRGK